MVRSLLPYTSMDLIRTSQQRTYRVENGRRRDSSLSLTRPLLPKLSPIENLGRHSTEMENTGNYISRRSALSSTYFANERERRRSLEPAFFPRSRPSSFWSIFLPSDSVPVFGALAALPLLPALSRGHGQTGVEKKRDPIISSTRKDRTEKKNTVTKLPADDIVRLVRIEGKKHHQRKSSRSPPPLG